MLKRLNLSSSILASPNKLWGKAVEPAKLEYTRGNQHVCPSCFTSCSKYPRRPSPSVSRHSRLSFTKGACKGLASAHKLAATISEQLETSDQSPLGYRDTMRDLAAVQIFRVAGVSFHNRQEPVNKLNTGMLSMLIVQKVSELHYRVVETWCTIKCTNSSLSCRGRHHDGSWAWERAWRACHCCQKARWGNARLCSKGGE